MTNRKRERPRFRSMRPRARLIGLIGDELISDEPVAIVELVKNAYDADAEEVTIRFEGEEAEHPARIVVQDNGSGMGLKTVVRGWLEPATAIKRRSDRSPLKLRSYLGAKGIGRFAAARLAERLRLETKRSQDTRAVIVDVAWEQFDQYRYLDQISIPYEVAIIRNFDHGTRLTMEGIRKKWEYQDYYNLHTRLSRLISPFEDVRDFTIKLSVPWYPDLDGEVQPPELISLPRYRLAGELNHEGYFTGQMLFDERLHKEFKELKVGGADNKPLCGGFQIEVRAWDRDREGLEPLSELLQKSITDMRKILNAFCGVSIYRDGFRVHPYGEPGNDWANLDIRSRQNPVSALANNQIVSSVKISRLSNPGLIDRSNREGMVLNEEHAALEHWLKEVLTILEKERYGLRPRKESLSDSQPLFESFDLKPTLREVRKQLGPRHPVTKLISQADEEIKKGVERVQEAFSRLLLLSGLGQMVDIVIHEIGAPVGKIARQLMLIEKEIEGIKEEGTREKISQRVTPIKSWLQQILLLRERLDPQTPAKRGRATVFYVRQAIEDCLQLCESVLNKQGVKSELIETNGAIRARMSRAPLDQILYNLIDNAVYWISREHGEGKGGTIRVILSPAPKGFRILVNDDGTGVAPEDRVRIFEPYFTSKQNGMGLGLHIARLVIEPYGRLLLRDECDLAGACFEAVFERNVGL
jgi:signal transduction histidine kinase